MYNDSIDDKKTNVYLAGKVGGYKWKLIEPIEKAIEEINNDGDNRYYDAGEYNFLASDKDEHGFRPYDKNTNEHGWGFAGHYFSNDDNINMVRERFLEKIEKCVSLLAYLDTPDSYGSIAELAVASSLDIECHVIIKAIRDKETIKREEKSFLEENEMSVEEFIDENPEYEIDPKMLDAYWFVCSLPNIKVYTVSNIQEGIAVAKEIFVENHKSYIETLKLCDEC